MRGPICGRHRVRSVALLCSETEFASRAGLRSESLLTAVTSQQLGAILIGPPRNRFPDPGRTTEEETLPEEVRRSLKTQQHAHPSTELRPRSVSRFDAVARRV